MLCDDNICTAFVSNTTSSQNNWPDDGIQIAEICCQKNVIELRFVPKYKDSCVRPLFIKLKYYVNGFRTDFNAGHCPLTDLVKPGQNPVSLIL
jgi:hypothetical protein